MNVFILTMLFPLLSFFILVAFQRKFGQNIIAIIGGGGIGISACVTVFLIFNFYYHFYDNAADFMIVRELCSWFKIDNMNMKIAFRLDRLSLLMLSIITGVGFIISIYSVGYMRGLEGYSRYFIYINLFIFNMILLILSDNLLLMYFGWEGVGLCSYLLIGFYYLNPGNGYKALKAFIVTRFGDICIMCALFMLYDQYHTLSLDKLLKLSPQCLSTTLSSWVSVFFVIGTVTKSAQFPLQTWLVSAMVGPTPVSALIHSATMVTAGVYLIYRLNDFFLVNSYILWAVSLVGAITLVIASCSALFQSNIKKILAYSTISQIGYMFLALGEKNWDGAFYHLTTHAFFKALLFLSAGSLIRACKDEQNIFKMGGLFQSMPFLYICFLVGGASLSGFPMLTSGFFSKKIILLNIFDNHNYFFLILGMIGVFLTPIYIFRMIFIIFHGKQLINPKVSFEISQYLPLVILLILSTVVGIKIPLFLLGSIDNNDFYMFDNEKIYFLMTSEILVFLGMWIAYVFWFNNDMYRTWNMVIFKGQLSSELITRYLVLLCHYGWGIDWLYKRIFVRPYAYIVNKLFYYDDFIGMGINMCASFCDWLGRCLIYIESRKIHWYILLMNVGAIISLLVLLMNLNM
ncbi:NADH-quinone oxidoreductase subunit L [Candidatus Blochmanniella vafra str. BVAF]|uniref:NADH-quinone oxidoreductase subunit L n=1 Tax=Blochmanniella vafra (strain BVAF) TaxID=859654 RepID=E8Q746_BLOVB|nr:NADH-quinone oxidoreductase subunit L [Candidatus Blochmannia vafer]ADV33870.1 NADH-quinone oxidoreductase subunit L [Candidatus Blochmannia vafer str. BVAF]